MILLLFFGQCEQVMNKNVSFFFGRLGNFICYKSEVMVFIFIFYLFF